MQKDTQTLIENRLFLQVDINDWNDLPKEEGAYWTSPDKGSMSATMVKRYIDPKDKKSRGYFRATSGSWFKPVTLEELNKK
jgi:hypothetical protein